MRQFVTKYVKACVNCLYYNSISGREPGFLHLIEKVVVPCYRLHLNHIGPFIRTKNNIKILTIIGSFTKFCTPPPPPPLHVKERISKDLAESHAYNPIRDFGETLGETFRARYKETWVSLKNFSFSVMRIKPEHKSKTCSSWSLMG